MVRGVRIRPKKQGIRTSLFDLEADIMEVVWSNGWAWFTVADVHRELARSRPLAYTTVMTTVVRLHDKELLERERDGRRYRYRARLSRAAFLLEMTREVLETLPADGSEAAVAWLVDRVAEADLDELRRLEDLIRRRRKELES